MSTLNAKLVANIPKRLNVAADCHVRGEVVMPLSVFNEKYRDVSPNPRNLCSGALRQKHGDGKADAADLVFCAYDVKFPGEQPAEDNDTGLLEWLQNAGIEPAPWTVFESDNITQEMIDYTKQWSNKRADYEFRNRWNSVQVRQFGTRRGCIAVFNEKYRKNPWVHDMPTIQGGHWHGNFHRKKRLPYFLKLTGKPVALVM